MSEAGQHPRPEPRASTAPLLQERLMAAPARPLSWERLAELRDGRPWMTNVILCMLGLGLLLLTKQFTTQLDHYTIGFSGCSGWSAWLYVAAVVVVLTQPVNRATFGIVIGFAVAFRAMTVFADPFLSSDIYRYVWDGIVQHAHISPYRYVPAAVPLKFLQDQYPDIFSNINRATYAHTIYPPVAQMIYWLVTFFSPTVVAMKAAMIGFECVTAGALLALLRLMGRPREQVLLYAWSPLLAWEIGGSGHVDAAVIAFMTLALLFRYRGQPALTGLFLGLAVMTKFYPLVLLPALYQRRDWKMPAVVAAVVAVGYAVYISAGKLVLGFLFGYTKEEGIDSGARFFLLDLTHTVRSIPDLPIWAYVMFCAAVLGGISLWAWRYATVEKFAFPSSALPPLQAKSARWGPRAPRMSGAPVAFARPAYLRAAMMLAFAMMLLFSPHYPWYIAWLVPFFALVPDVTLLTYLMAFSYLFTTALAAPGPKMFLLNKIMYGLVAAALVLQVVVLRHWPLRRMFRLDEPAEARDVLEPAASCQL
jgi:alpha-1,6-mannosyltransferase